VHEEKRRALPDVEFHSLAAQLLEDGAIPHQFRQRRARLANRAAINLAPGSWQWEEPSIATVAATNGADAAKILSNAKWHINM
jgi:hypothetical protein